MAGETEHRLILITGGSASGKSQLAEQYACMAADEAGLLKYYLATMEIRDAEMARKVRRHQERRAGKGWQTIECPVDIAQTSAETLRKRNTSCLLSGSAKTLRKENKSCLLSGSAETLRKENKSCLSSCSAQTLRKENKSGLLSCSAETTRPEERSEEDKESRENMENSPSQGCLALLECMSNLAANEMFRDGAMISAESTVKKILPEIRTLRQQSTILIIVTNEVFSDGVTYDEGTMEYLRALGQINTALAAEADEVYEAVVGIPVRWR